MPPGHLSRQEGDSIMTTGWVESQSKGVPIVMNVGIVGMGFVGLTLALRATDGHNVIGVDSNSSVVESLRARQPLFYEPGLEDSLDKASSNGTILAETKLRGDWCEVVVICVGTPMSNSGEIDTSGVKLAVEDAINNTAHGTLIIIRSTVPVGTTQELANQYNSHLFAFCPERTIEGKAMEELVSLPQIIGSNDEKVAEKAMQFFQAFGVNLFSYTGIGEAEFAKLATNAFRDVNFAFANELAMFSMQNNVDAYEAIRVSNLGYERSRIPLPGITGGPCLSKDPMMVKSPVEGQSVISSARRMNENSPKKFLDSTLRNDELRDRFRGQTPRALIMGLAFKGQPETSDVRDSAVAWITRAIREIFETAEIYGYDPAVNESAVDFLGLDGKLVDLSTMTPHIVVVQHNGESVRSALEQLGQEEGLLGATVIDFWNLTAGLSLKGTDIFVFGSGKQ